MLIAPLAANALFADSAEEEEAEEVKAASAPVRRAHAKQGPHHTIIRSHQYNVI